MRAEDLLDVYDTAWHTRTQPGKDGAPPPVRYPTKSDPAQLRQLAQRMLETFQAHADTHIGEVIAVEEEFLIPIAPGMPVLKGRIDLVEIRKNEEGEEPVHLVDFKTSAKRMRLEDVDRDQLDLYALAARRTGLLEQ